MRIYCQYSLLFTGKNNSCFGIDFTHSLPHNIDKIFLSSDPESENGDIMKSIGGRNPTRSENSRIMTETGIYRRKK